MPKRQKRHATLTELLRRALSKAESLREVERQTGVKRQSMMKFLRSEQSIRLDLADRLASHFKIQQREQHMKAHDHNTKTFRELSLSQMKASIGAMQRHLNDAKRVYREEKGKRAISK